MVRVAKVTCLPMGAVMLVGRPVILSSPRITNWVPPCGGAGGGEGAASAGGWSCRGGPPVLGVVASWAAAPAINPAGSNANAAASRFMVPLQDRARAQAPDRDLARFWVWALDC